ncbi:MAG: hypothetical protein RL511_203 [Bacteroidota bacterium]
MKNICKLIGILLLSQVTLAQGNITGNMETVFQYLNEDSVINAKQPLQKGLLNSYMNVFYTQGNFKAGMRFESYLPRIQGYPNRFDGTGIGMRYVGYQNDFVDVTLGTFYEQFGSGLALRTYEDRNLGYDNLLDGMRIVLRPGKGLVVKGVYGTQRLSFQQGQIVHGAGLVRGTDAEWHLNEGLGFLKDKKLDVVLGASFVSKYQEDNNPEWVLPQNVAAYGGRVKLTYGNFYADGEFIQKGQDPSSDNHYIYNQGHAAIFNLRYTKKGLGILLSGKSVDNMSYRSDRTKDLQDLLINFLPSLNKTHTYNLVATLYPYATQPMGEVAYQADFLYTIKKGTKLGGKYGTTLGLNYSTTYRPQQTLQGIDLNDSSRVIYHTRPFAMSDSLYWQDINFNITKKFNKQWSGILSFYDIKINNDVVKVSNAKGIIHSRIAVLEGTYKINTHNALRWELQGMWVQRNDLGINDKGNWATALLEYTISPGWFFSVMNQYNYGNDDTSKRVNYPIVICGYIKDATRLTVSYGRQRAGLFCVGGVCRPVPANNGLMINLTHSF